MKIAILFHLREIRKKLPNASPDNLDFRVNSFNMSTRLWRTLLFADFRKIPIKGLSRDVRFRRIFLFRRSWISQTHFGLITDYEWLSPKERAAYLKVQWYWDDVVQ